MVEGIEAGVETGPSEDERIESIEMDRVTPSRLSCCLRSSLN